MPTAEKPVEIVPTAYPNPLVNHFLYDFSRVSRFFGYDPGQLASFQRRAAFLQGRYGPRHREALANVLESYNRGLDTGRATLANIQKLRRGALVVIGGQQAGVLTGPLYAVHKAITAVQLARYLTSKLGVDVVPAFWVASDDHDFAEIDHVDVLKLAPGGGSGTADGAPGKLVARGATIERLRLAAPEGAGDFPAGRLPCTPEAVNELLDAVAATTPSSEFKDSVLQTARELASQSTNLAEWFGRLMTRIFDGTGLVLVDPMAPGFKALPACIDSEAENLLRDAGDSRTRPMTPGSAKRRRGAASSPIPAPAMAHFVSRTAAIAGALEERNHKLAEAGYPLQVEKDTTHTHLFMYLSWRRRPVYWEPDTGRFVVRRGPLSMTPDEFYGVVASNPDAISPDVVLRPVWQDMVLPVIAMLGGPGEISYLAQLGEVYRLFGLELPVVFPRLNLTLIEPAEARLLEKYDLGATAIAASDGLATARDAHLAQADKVGLPDLFASARDRVAGVYADLRDGLAAVDKGLVTLTGENKKRVVDQITWLEGRAAQAHRKANELAMGHFDRLEKAYRPEGNWQERVYNIFPFLFKYGPELCKWLCDQPLLGEAPFDFGHRFIYL